MLTAYESIFAGIPYLAIVLVSIALLSILLQKSASVGRSILFSFGFWLAPLFYIMYVILAHRINSVIVAALSVELLILIVYQLVFSRLLSLVGDTGSLNIRSL